jgi:hypothetical protein
MLKQESATLLGYAPHAPIRRNYWRIELIEKTGLPFGSMRHLCAKRIDCLEFLAHRNH